MLRVLYTKLQSEYNSYGRCEKLFVFFMMLCSFGITGEAAITRAVANSLFLSSYGSHFFPTVWLASVPLNFSVVFFYNRFLPKLGCIKMLTLSICITCFLNLFCAFWLQNIWFLSFILYLWKDIFIILMFHQLWSVIHATINISRAKYLYGIFFGMGGLGSILGGLIPSLLAVRLGSEKLLLLTLPFYGVVLFSYVFALRIREGISHKQDICAMNSDSTDFLGGLKLIHQSRFLQFILLIVLSMQVTSTILEFQFNNFLENIFFTKDLRTQFLGRFFSIINTINVFAQFFGSYILVKCMGLQSSHLLVPCILGINAICFLISPNFGIICLSYGTIKAMDYSIFGIIKEMLYIPLKIDEKFKAKAIIDVFVYRTSKAFASIIILGIQMCTFAHVSLVLSWSVFFIVILWMGSIPYFFTYYHQTVDQQISLKKTPSISTK